MHWENLWESFNKVKAFGEKRERTVMDLMNVKDKLRAEISKIFTIRKINEGRYVSVGAVDSSFGELIGDDWGRRMYAVCVSGIGITPNAFIQKDPEWLTEECIFDYEEDGDYLRILRGLAIAKEIHSAKQWFSNMDLVLIDGSAKSSIIAINQAMTSKNLENSTSGRELKAIYKETLDALYDMLYTGVLVFIPKRSSEVLIANKISLPINNNNAKNDYAVLDVVLEKGEYVIVDVEFMQEAQPWVYTLPKIEGVSEEFLSKLFGLLKNLKVIYFKSLLGRTIKLETCVPLSVNTVWELFILEGENILAYYTDKTAKDYLKELKTAANEVNLWNYRVKQGG